ncbi:hypothetical protein MHYP_G00322780 [Metynnis hypsauchen]
MLHVQPAFYQLLSGYGSGSFLPSKRYEDWYKRKKGIPLDSLQPSKLETLSTLTPPTHAGTLHQGEPDLPAYFLNGGILVYGQQTHTHWFLLFLSLTFQGIVIIRQILTQRIPCCITAEPHYLGMTFIYIFDQGAETVSLSVKLSGLALPRSHQGLIKAAPAAAQEQ